MIGGEGLDPFNGVDAGFGGLQRLLVDIGRIKKRPIFEPFFAKQDDHGIKFFAAAAAGNPYFQRWIGSQMWYDAFTNGAEIIGIAEHVADLNGQKAQQLWQHGRIAQQALLHGGETRELQLFASLPQPPPDRAHRVISEIIMVAQIKRLQQQSDLDFLRRTRLVLTGHLGIQTRTSDSSLSTSSGLAM
jgi:hypothetical protein